MKEVKILIQSPELFEAVFNFRDMGGVQTKDGRTVRYRHLYRCGEISHATQHDLQLLDQLELKTILDYRDEEEAIVSPTPSIQGADYVRISATLTATLRMNPSLEEVHEQSDTLFTEANFLQAYRQLPFKNPAYRALMDRVVTKDVPLLQHCTAGKDRTGVGTALVYLLLGVDEDTIVHEYLQTNAIIDLQQPEWYTHWAATFGHMTGFTYIAKANEECLRASLQAILETYDSYDTYFFEEFGITKAMQQDVQSYYLK